MPHLRIDPLLKGKQYGSPVLLARRTANRAVGFVHPFLSMPLLDRSNGQSYIDYTDRLVHFHRNLPFNANAFYVMQDRNLAGLLRVILKCNLGKSTVLVSQTGKLELKAERRKGGGVELFYPVALAAKKEQVADLCRTLASLGSVVLVGIRNAVHSGIDGMENAANSLYRLARQAGFPLEIEIFDELVLRLPFPNKYKLEKPIIN